MGDRPDVRAAEAAWLRAHLDVDVEALDGLMAEEYMQVQPDGSLWDKGTVLASLGDGIRQWTRAEVDELIVHDYGDLAVVCGRWAAAGSNAGNAFDYAARYISVWVHRDGRWQMVTDQSTEIG